MTLLLDAIASDQPIYDGRDSSTFVARRIKKSVNLPYDQLFTRMHEFPDKSLPFVYLVDSAGYEHAERFFQDKNIAAVSLIHSDEIEKLDKSLLTNGASTHFFWRPSPLIETFFGTQPFDSTHDKEFLDIACGAGRDINYAALQGLVTYGVDYSSTALERAKATADYHGTKVNLAECDVEAEIFDLPKTFPTRFDVVSVARFLHRPLLTHLKNLLKPDGYLLYHTFMVGSEKYGSPKNPRFLLHVDELRNAFNDLRIVKDDVIYLPDKRPMSCFIAQKQA